MKLHTKFRPYHDAAAKKILAAVLQHEIEQGMTVPGLGRRWSVNENIVFELVYLLTGKTVREIKSTEEAETPVLGQ